jgi:hypothetical protein
MWATDAARRAPGQLWRELLASGERQLSCVLLESQPLGRLAPWDTGFFSPHDASEIDALDPAAVLATMWANSTPSPEQYAEDLERHSDEDRRERPWIGQGWARTVAPLGREWPGLAAAEIVRLDQDVIDSALAGQAPARIGVVIADRLADVPGAIGSNENVVGRLQPLDVSAVLRSWEDRFGARLLRLGGATIDLLVERP